MALITAESARLQVLFASVGAVGTSRFPYTRRPLATQDIGIEPTAFDAATREFNHNSTRMPLVAECANAHSH